MLTLAPLFGNRCVLPMGKELRIFGEADEGRVEITLTAPDGRVLSAASAPVSDGRYLAYLPAVDDPMMDGTLTAVCNSETVVSGHIAVGLLFLAGGQSNMELELQNADEGQQLIEHHCDDGLRYFNVPKRALLDEEALQAGRLSRWESIRPGMGRDMSAVAYFFAARLRRAYGAGMPVGIIDCYWGGTSITCWMDEEALLRTAEGRRYMDAWNAQCGGKTMEQFRAEWNAFEAAMDEWNQRCSVIRARDPGITYEALVAEAGYCPWNPPAGPGSPFRPAGLCATMLCRVAPAALTGFLYYQAEEDAWRTTCYEQLMMQLVLRWRELFQDMELPFLYMQLPMWIDKVATDDGTWARTRMAQKKAQQMIARTAMVCLIDCGELDNIHPTDKRTPGERMAYEWLRLAHPAQHAKVPPLTPEAIRKHTDGSALLITLSAPVEDRGTGDAALFEIAGEDGVYTPAQAILTSDTTLRLTAPAVPYPIHARYAYKAFARVGLFGKTCTVWSPEEGLLWLQSRDAVPLAPFAL